jgi:2-keto-3-deoxy-6-phosphogluconate aldolase
VAVGRVSCRHPTKSESATLPVNQKTAPDYLAAGSTALGIGTELISRDAIRRRREDHIGELARRFLEMIKAARDRGVE